MHKLQREAVCPQLPLPDKLFYKIGEVSRIAAVESYVLRYWETEFPFLKPRKNKSGQRVYTKKDLEIILLLKKMLYQERFTIEGVRKKFSEGIMKSSEPKVVSSSSLKYSQDPAGVVEFVKKRLGDILSQIR
jgi:DNA-binding transcriptional MerR regulator